MEKIFLYNADFFWGHRLKTAVKKKLGRNFGGPQAVFANLVAGLQKLGKQVLVNNPNPGAVTAVVAGYKTLEWAIRKKQKGEIKKIVAGPNVALTPLHHDKVAQHPAIDAYVVPSRWTYDWWADMAPAMKPKLVIWPSGVPDLGDLRSESGHCLVYWKSGPKELRDGIVALLNKEGVRHREILYGTHTPQEYFEILSNTKFMVYISESESQGLALHEAWMGDIPTLVWNRGFAQVGPLRVEDFYIAAPYLIKDCGLFFSGIDDFPEKLNYFLSAYNFIHPRSYSLLNFSLESSAKKYLHIIQSL